MTPENLTARYPIFYHMAEVDTWESIKQHGLLSTSAILDLHNIGGQSRLPYESYHRPDMMTVGAHGAFPMVLRDQKPMSDARLEIGLQGDLTPRDWYELLNRKVFFWATEARLHTLLNARDYRTVEHDVLAIDARSFVAAYGDRIELCHMNSGNTFPIPHRRDASIFAKIADYPTKTNGAPQKEVAEVTVDYRVEDILSHVIEVHKMRGSQSLGTIYTR